MQIAKNGVDNLKAIVPYFCLQNIYYMIIGLDKNGIARGCGAVSADRVMY